LVRKPDRRDHLEDLSAEGRIILKLIKKEWCKRFVDWDHLAEDRD
jgi:hypothetical protein